METWTLAKGYRFATGLGSIVMIVAWGVGLAFITLWIGQFVQWIDYRRLNHIGLKQRSENAYRNFQSLLGKGRELTNQETSNVFALFTDLQTYVDQGAYAYGWRTLEKVERILRLAESR